MGGSAVPALTESIVRHWSLAVTAGELNAGAGVAAKKDGEETQRRHAAFPRPRDNRSPAASEGRYRGSDLAVTAPELNAGAGVGRLG